MSEPRSGSRVGGAVAAFLFVGLGGGILYSALRIHELTFDLDEIRQKMGRKASLPTASTGPSAPAVTVLPSATPAAGDLTGEVDRLRKELEALKAALGAQPAPSTTTDGSSAPAFMIANPPADGSLPEPLVVAMESMTAEQKVAFKKSVLAIVDEREREHDAKKQEKKKNEVVEQLAKQLGLTDTQRDRVQITVDQASARISELKRSQNDTNQDQVRNDIKTTMKTADDGIRLLLTSEQVSLYDQWKTQQNPRQMFGVGGGGGGDGKPKLQKNPNR